MASFKKVFTSFIWLIIPFLASCLGMEHSEHEKLRRQNAKGEFIHRTHSECRYPLSDPEHFVREKYPWEKTFSGKHPQITKEYFRCKGSSTHPPHTDSAQSPVFDCGGAQRHSLPIVNERENIYPVLIDLLNFVQEKTGCPVVITCGHRCPVHNTYADPSTYNQNSKHMIGAEVDFYVEGMQGKPEQIVQLLMDYYKGHEKAYQQFERLNSETLNVSTPPWMNKEILIKLYTKEEGRDFDNRHSYPYISIQVRYDKERNEKVTCSWQKAFHGYRRF